MTRAPLPARPSDGSGGSAPAAGSHAPVAPEHLRVVVFSDAIPGRNGVGTFYQDLAAALEPHVGAIRIIAPPVSDPAEHRGWSIPMPGDPTQRIRIPWPPQIWQQVKWMKPHVILAATPGVYGLVGMLMALRLRTGRGLCYHTEIPKLAETYWTGLTARLATAALTFWDRMMVRWSPAVLAPNADLVRLLAVQGRTDAQVMGTLAPVRFIEAPLASVPEQIRTVAFIGRLAPEKRIEAFIEAAQAHPGLAFRVVGDGPLRAEVERAAADGANLSYTPWVDRERVMSVMDATDLLVLPSRHETFGSAAFEAMARGRLALVSAECGITQWPTLGPGLFVMEPHESVATAIARIQALPPEALTRVALAARRAAVELHEDGIASWLRTLARLAPLQSE